MHAGVVTSEPGVGGSDITCDSLTGVHRRWGVAPQMASSGPTPSVGCLHAQWLCGYALPCPALPCPALPRCALPCPVLHRLALLCLIPSCRTLPCPTLHCPPRQSNPPCSVWPCPASQPMCPALHCLPSALLCLHDNCLQCGATALRNLLQVQHEEPNSTPSCPSRQWLILLPSCCMTC